MQIKENAYFAHLIILQRDQMSPLQQRLIEQLLLSGLGTYQQVLSRLELDFGAPLIGIIDAALRFVSYCRINIPISLTFVDQNAHP